MKITLLLIMYLLICQVQRGSQLYKNKTYVRGNGYIRIVDSENNIFVIKTYTGKTYVPSNLKTKYKINNLKVVFEGNIETSKLKNVRLIGIPIKLKKINLEN